MLHDDFLILERFFFQIKDHDATQKKFARKRERVERIIKLIAYLNDYRTLREIANYLGISYKSVGRYINLLTKLGFKIDRKFGKFNSFKVLNAKEVFRFE